MSTLSYGRLDFYDDRGALLKEAVPDVAQIPDFVKTAAQVGPDDHNNQFALVMINEDGTTLRKYATADAGNTWLSALYFCLTHSALPPEAEKTAAANILLACEAYGIDAPAPVVELSGDAPPTGNLVYIQDATPAPRVVEKTKTAGETALPGRYPLGDPASVQAAQAYFAENGRVMTPPDRHTFAVKTAAAARALGLPVRKEIAEHGGAGYSPQLEGHLTSRQHYLVEAGNLEAAEAVTKLAAARKAMHPVEFATALDKLDRECGLDAGWDRVVADPWYATFGVDYGSGADAPAATLIKVAADGSMVILGDLVKLSASGAITEHFGAKVGQEFAKDPEAVFASLPLPQRKLIAELAAAQ